MAVTTADLERRRARKLLKRGFVTPAPLLAGPPDARTRLVLVPLEDRVVPAITGTVFQDYNANGQFDTNRTIPNVSAGVSPVAVDRGVGAVTVTAFDAGNRVVGTATTNAAGQYTLTPTGPGPFRVEFGGLPPGYTFGPVGTNRTTAVQFVPSENQGNVNLAIGRADDFAADNPLLATSQYVFGGISPNDLNPGRATIIGTFYDSGAPADDPNLANHQASRPQPLAVAHNQVGATWGLGYNAATNQLYAAAYMKRHTGFGPNGPGAIYATGTAGTTANIFADLNDIFPADSPAGNLGELYRTNANVPVGLRNDIPGAAASEDDVFQYWARDGLRRVTDSGGVVRDVGWDAVGKIALGGLDVTPDGGRVFVMALGDRRLYSLPTAGPITAATVQRFNIPVPESVTGRTFTNPLGDLRPFAVEEHRGIVYVGAVNTAESTQNRADLKAYVFAFDPARGTFVNLARQATTTEAILTVDLSYDRGIAHKGGDLTPQGVAPPDPAEWNPWSPTFRSNPQQPDALGRVTFPQPMLSGLAFDADGNMTLGLRDRLGDQVGYQAPVDPNDPNNFSYFGITAGDTLRAFINAPGNLDAAQLSSVAPLAGWTLESNSRGPNGQGTGPQNNGQGPGGGEFYYDDDLPRDPSTRPVGVDREHDEVTVGGVAQVPGFPEIVTTAFDPVRLAGRVNTGGFRWFSNTTGDLTKSYELYFTPFTFPQATFAKANGIGDLVAVTGVPPVEIGDRVWSDDNENGVQDANEAGIPGVSVQLFDAQARLIATATTDANGTYIFSAAAGANTASTVFGLPLRPGTAYQIQIPFGQPVLGGRSLTNPFANSGPGSELRDSNALSVLGTGVINLVTGVAGEGNHTFDAGYLPRPLVAVGDFVWNDTNNNGRFDGAEQGIDGVTVRLYAADGTTLLGTTTTGNGGQYFFRNLAPGTYVAEIVPPAGFRSSTGTNGSASGPFEPGVADAPGTNNTDHGTQAGAVIRSAPFQVFAPGDARNPDSTGALPFDANFRIDFGLIRPLSLGDVVWNDINNDGRRQPGEPGLGNVTLNLRDAGGALVASTVTNGSGGYLFTNLLPGQYRVEVVRGTLPAGFISSTGRPGTADGPFEPAPGTTGDDTDHGTTAGGVVTGTLVALGFGTAPLGEGATPGGIPDPAADANSDRTQDFGFFRPLSLGDFVWDDRNNTGVFEAGVDVPFDGVTVQLLDAGFAVIGTTTTAGGGKYLFTNLAPGTYTVRLLTPAGYVSSTGKNGSLTSGPFEPGTTANIDDRDHGTTVGNIIVAAPVTLGLPGDTAANPDADGFANLKQDFGLIRPLSLGDFVWEDANNNGRLDAGERPLAGVPVTLLDAAGNVIGTTATSADGVYGFTGLSAGDYVVRITPPAGYRSSTGTNGSLTGPYEPGITANRDNEDHGTQVGAVVESRVSLALPGDAANPDNGGLANLRQDFGLFRPLAVGDFVWEDVNNNGRLDTGEAGIPDVPVQLLDAAGNVIGTVTTDANGGYRFSNLAPGGYTVRITAPAGYRSSTGTNGSASGPYEPGVNGNQNNEDHGTAAGAFVTGGAFTLDTAGSANNPDEGGTANLRQDFGLFRPLAVGNFVFRDVGNDGRFNNSDSGVAGVPVRLLDAGGSVIASAVTDAAGNYLFTNLAPGQYRVEITPPAGFTSSTGTLNSPTGPFEPVTVDSGADSEDKGTAAAGGVIRATVITLGLPGSATNPDLGGTANLRQDFGLVTLEQITPEPPPPPPPPIVVPPPPPPPATIPAQVSGYVYVDINTTNGLFERPAERPIPGTTVTLTGNGITRTTLTDRNGFYQFTNLPPGDYVITETQPLGFLDGIDTIGTLGGTLPRNDVQTVTLREGDDGLEYNFGEVLPAAVFGFVYEDVNRNRRRDPGEPPIPGTTVTLSGTAFAGTPLARPLTAADSPVGLVVQTDPTGRYEFPFLPPGNYTIVETQPAGFEDFFESVQEPFTRPATVGNDVFSDVPADPGETRGPLNFGEVRAQAATADEPTKRDFLGSTQPDGAEVPPTVTPPITVGPTDLPQNPPFSVTTGNPGEEQLLVTAAGAGRAPLVRVFDYATGTEKFRFFAYGTDFVGGVRVATGDVDGDGTDDIVTSTGVGGGPQVRVFSGKDGSVIRNFFAYEAEFRGGVFVASGDVDGDGADDIITGTEIGGGPRVTVFSGRTGQTLQNFFAFDLDQRGGVRVAAADFNADGRADIVATTGAGVPTRVRVFDAVTNTTLTDFAPYEAAYTGGVFIAAGTVLGGATPDIVVGADVGGGPRVQVFRGLSGQPASNFFAYDASFTGGARVSVLDVDGDGLDELVTAPGPGAIPQIRIWRGATVQQVETFAALDNTSDGGVFVG